VFSLFYLAVAVPQHCAHNALTVSLCHSTHTLYIKTRCLLFYRFFF